MKGCASYSLFFLLAVVNVFARANMADSESESYQTEFQEYIETSNEYMSNLDQLISSELKIRESELSDEFREKIRGLESSLRSQNKSDAEFIEKYLLENEKNVYLDDSLLMQFALLNFKKANFAMESAMSEYQVQLEAYYAKKTNLAPSMPAPNYKDAIYYAKRLTREFPHSELSAYALYFIGSIQEEQSEFDQALESYKKYLSDYPYSKHREEVQWRYAELLSDSSKELVAQSIYQELLKSKSTEIKVKSLYKIIAFHYSQKNYEKVQSYLEEFDKILQENESGNASVQLYSSLRSEFNEYLGLIYVRGINIDSFSRENRLNALNAVAKRLDRHNQRLKSQALFRDLIEKNYYSSQVPSYYLSLVKLMEEAGEIEKSVETRERLKNHLRKNGKWWVRNSDLRTRYEAEGILEDSSLFLARYYVANSNSRNSRQNFSLAKKEFESFLALNPSRNLLGTVYFELAQVEQNLDLKKEAIESYRKAIEFGLDKEDMELASYSLFFLEVKKLGYQLGSLDKESLSKNRNLNEKEESIVGIFNSLKAMLGDENLIAIQSYIAQIYASAGQLDFSKRLLEEILFNETYISGKFDNIQFGVNLLQEIYVVQQNWEGIKELRQKTSKYGLYNSKLELARSQSFKNAKLLSAKEAESRGDDASARSMYLSFLGEFSQDSESSMASLSLAQLYRRNYQYRQSNEVLKKISAEELMVDASLLQMQNYIDIADLDSSVATFNKLPLKVRQNERLVSMKKYVDFLNTKNSYNDIYYDAYLSSKNPALAIQSIKHLVSKNELELAKKLLKQFRKELKNEKEYQLALTNLDFLFSIRESNFTVALEKCDQFIKKYAQMKKTNASTQSLYFNCEFMTNLDLGMDKAQIKERFALYQKNKDFDALDFSKIVLKLKKLDVPTDSEETIKEDLEQNLAYSNWLRELEGKESSFAQNIWSLFPFHIFRAEQFLVYRPEATSFVSLCVDINMTNCYLKISRLYKKTKELKYLDNLMYMSLIFDNDNLAKKWAKALVSNRLLSKEIATNLFATDIDEISERISSGEASVHDYFVKIQTLSRESKSRIAMNMASQVATRFAENPLVEVSSHLLTGKELPETEIIDAKDLRLQYLWFLNKVVSKKSFAQQSSYPQEKGSEWHKSAMIFQSIWEKEELGKLPKIRSAYGIGLLAIKNYRMGNWQSAQVLWSRSERMGAKFGGESVNVLKREVASE